MYVKEKHKIKKIKFYNNIIVNKTFRGKIQFKHYM